MILTRECLWDYLSLALLGLITLGVLAMLGGCASAGAREQPIEQALPPVAVAQPSDGAIYASGGGMSLFEDTRARNVGDILTIVLVESTAAKSSAETKTGKTTSASISAPKIFGREVTIHGTSVLSGALDSDHSFDGSGDTSQSNTLSGNVTVTVVARQANGNLVVRGEKHLVLNQGNETVRVEGIVRPADIAPDNSIVSSRVADARISYDGKGTLAESNTKGWLARFFSSPLMPF
ncbi:MAG TPA: flagellar basal body L-ring protein FlgH [Nevskiaceae bacterium]|nr:flagellar basal body L-ring protein FlgH [Nevskiaceae bacterium]